MLSAITFSTVSHGYGSVLSSLNELHSLVAPPSNKDELLGEDKGLFAMLGHTFQQAAEVE
jgi:hypothetical protein